MIEFSLNTCGHCACNATALMVGDETGGYRLTPSSIGMWRLVRTLQPGDPLWRQAYEEYLDAPMYIQERYPVVLPDNIEELESLHFEAVKNQSLQYLTRNIKRNIRGAYPSSAARQKLSPYAATCGDVLKMDRKTFLSHKGVGQTTYQDIRSAFRNLGYSWPNKEYQVES